MTVTALIVAAGKGERLGGELPKQYRPIGGKPVLRWAVEALTGHSLIDQVRVVIGEGHEQMARSALAGLPAVVDRLLTALEGNDGAVPVLPVADTLALGDAFLDSPVDRRRMLRVQTPQAFHVEDLIYAYEEAGRSSATDESTIMLAAGLKVAAVEGDPMLEKLTTPADWQRAEAILASHLIPRTGMGYDVHAFAGEGPIMLGGIAVPHSRGLAGNSDADVVLHAITDALLGAAGLGDIGE